MRYLVETDFSALITPEELCIISQDAQSWAQAELTAIELASGYLRGRYDVEATFRLQGAARNPMLVHVVAVLSVWQCIHRLPERMGYDRWEPLHEDAMRYLEDVQRGRNNPDLPTPQSSASDATSLGPVRFGGLPRSTYDY